MVRLNLWILRGVPLLVRQRGDSIKEEKRRLVRTESKEIEGGKVAQRLIRMLFLLFLLATVFLNLVQTRGDDASPTK